MRRLAGALALLVMGPLGQSCSVLFDGAKSPPAADARTPDSGQLVDAGPGELVLPQPLVRYRITAEDCPNLGNFTEDCVSLADDGRGEFAADMTLSYGTTTQPSVLISPIWSSNTDNYGLEFREKLGGARAEYIVGPDDKLATQLHGSKVMTIEMKYRFTRDCATANNGLEQLDSRLLEIANGPTTLPAAGYAVHNLYLAREGAASFLTWGITSSPDEAWQRMRHENPCLESDQPIVGHWVLDLRAGSVDRTRAYSDGEVVPLQAISGDSEPISGGAVVLVQDPSEVVDGGPTLATKFRIGDEFLSNRENAFEIFSLAIYTDALTAEQVRCRAASLLIADDISPTPLPGACLLDN